jgi:hypothetical protein
MMGRVGERLRASWSSSARGDVDSVREELTKSWTSSFDELRREVAAERAEVAVRVADRELELVKALHRVADTFGSIAESLESERRERRAQLDAVEFLLREMVIGFAAPTSVVPMVRGGTVDPAALGTNRRGEVEIDLSDSPIRVGALVEVRSRFHDQWVHGFSVAEYIPGPNRRGYRLRRHTDTEPLPLLFDAVDVRRATVVTDHSADQTEEPEPSMWR